MEKRTTFDPAVHGFAFPNAFVDVLATLPNGTKISTAGRCGGMAYVSLDLFHAAHPAPRWGPQLYGAARVPPDDNWLADAIRGRLFDSFRVLSAASFVTWSLYPDGALGPLKGVRRWTAEDQLPRVVRAVDEGRPVPLGLITARSVGAVGKNHQVVAHGYTRTGSTTSVLITDSNSPGREVTLTPGTQGWVASNGPVWRGFFIQDYAPKKVVALTDAPAEPSHPVSVGDVVALSHVWTGMTLHAEGARVTAVRRTATDDERWEVVAGAGTNNQHANDVLQLRHHATGQFLKSRSGARSPVTAQQLVRTGAEPDDWQVEVDGGGPWLAGSRVRLVHAASGAALHSHLHSSSATDGQQEVTGFAARDDNDWWTVLEVS